MLGLVAASLLTACCTSSPATTAPVPSRRETTADRLPVPPPSTATETTAEEPGREPVGIAHLVIESEPAGAWVFLDEGEEAIGRTPHELSILSGTHSLGLEWDEGAPARDDDEDEDDDTADVVNDLSFEAGHDYRFLTARARPDLRVERDARSTSLCGVVTFHRDTLRATGIPMSESTYLAVRFALDGTPELAQAFGEIESRAAHRATDEILGWRFVASDDAERFYAFDPLLSSDCEQDPSRP